MPGMLFFEIRSFRSYPKYSGVRLIGLLLLLSLTLLIACSSSTQSSTQSSTIRLTEADNERSIEVHKGDVLEVKLPANPTTGFQWEIKAVNRDILLPLGEPKFESSGNAVGSGGTVTLSFEAVGPGQTK